jgi:hypothetical protein
VETEFVCSYGAHPRDWDADGLPADRARIMLTQVAKPRLVRSLWIWIEPSVPVSRLRDDLPAERRGNHDMLWHGKLCHVTLWAWVFPELWSLRNHLTTLY